MSLYQKIKSAITVRQVGEMYGMELTPMVQSVAAVPCGVTDYRQNLFKQTPYDAATSAEVIDIMEEFGDECKRRHGKRIIYPSDEWYLKAGRPIPPPEFYEDYDQLENGHLCTVHHTGIIPERQRSSVLRHQRPVQQPHHGGQKAAEKPQWLDFGYAGFR